MTVEAVKEKIRTVAEIQRLAREITKEGGGDVKFVPVVTSKKKYP